MARQVEIFIPASQDDSFIEQNMQTMFCNFIDKDATAGRFGIGDGEQMQRVTFTITSEMVTYQKPAEPQVED
ncbi:hypothetical protein PBC5_gp23 [Sinorhizobium phage PBC5]|uniref:hypothetical protein n=1 Tax=Sinorhizobium phage PBC5 TaxID=179237 RepID=UPI001BEABC65|nr:hypothetical protein PBC5_gp23 [Sinorhizobium phage PBC5]